MADTPHTTTTGPKVRVELELTQRERLTEILDRLDNGFKVELTQVEVDFLRDLAKNLGEVDGLRKALEEAEDRFESCDNCERPSREEDLKVVWGREAESGELVDARICLVCRLEAERDDPAAKNLGDGGQGEGGLRKRVLDEVRALTPHEVPCDCPARGAAELDQHADECPRGAVGLVLDALEARPLKGDDAPRCGGSGEFPAVDDCLAAEHGTEPCPGCPDCQPAPSYLSEEGVRPEIPDDYWRSVPCGHPLDPVAMYGDEGKPLCHCGVFLNPAATGDFPVPSEAPGPIVPCPNCGCCVAIPPDPASLSPSSDTGGADPVERCDATDASRFRCERPKDHDGDHLRETPKREIRWHNSRAIAAADRPGFNPSPVQDRQVSLCAVVHLLRTQAEEAEARPDSDFHQGSLAANEGFTLGHVQALALVSAISKLREVSLTAAPPDQGGDRG